MLLVRQREGDAAGAERLADRAAALYLAGRYADAIAPAGRALPWLVDGGSRATLLRALDILAESYLQMGLPWAARGAWLAASAVVGADDASPASMLPRIVPIFDRLRSVELELGRLAQSLAVHRVYRAAARMAIVDDVDLRELVDEADARYEVGLSQALLRVDTQGLAHLTTAPGLLDRLELLLARDALFASLGHEDRIPGLDDAPEELQFMEELVGLIGGPSIDSAALEPAGARRMKSRVLGVAINVTHDQGSPATEIAESLLGTLEALLATGARHEIIGWRPEIRILVRLGHFSPWPWRIRSDFSDDRAELELAYTDFDPAALTHSQQDRIRDHLRGLVARIVSFAYHIDELQTTLERLLGGERALDRSLNFGPSFVTAGDLMGKTHELGLRALMTGDEQAFEVRTRTLALPAPATRPSSLVSVPIDLATLPHDRMRIAHTAINIALWDAARWRGMYFATVDGVPPLIALGFEKPGPARRIWEGWEQGSSSLDDLLRVDIVTGVDVTRPNDYRVVISPNLAAAGDEAAVVIEAIRVHDMNPDDGQNLNRFRAAFDESQSAVLGILHLDSGPNPTGGTLLGSGAFNNIRIRSIGEIADDDAMAPFRER